MSRRRFRQKQFLCSLKARRCQTLVAFILRSGEQCKKQLPPLHLSLVAPPSPPPPSCRPGRNKKQKTPPSEAAGGSDARRNEGAKNKACPKVSKRKHCGLRAGNCHCACNRAPRHAYVTVQKNPSKHVNKGSQGKEGIIRDQSVFVLMAPSLCAEKHIAFVMLS